MNLIRTTSIRKVRSLIAVVAITLAFTTISARRSASAAEPAEQVIFSGIGFTNDGQKVGFWIWCTPEGNSPVYTGACRGSIHLYGQDNAVGVQGFVVENPDGTYVAQVGGNKASSFLFAAAFHNVDPEPVSGPHNTVQFGMLTLDGVFSTGVSTDAVVNVTGPGD